MKSLGALRRVLGPPQAPTKRESAPSIQRTRRKNAGGGRVGVHARRAVPRQQLRNRLLPRRLRKMLAIGRCVGWNGSVAPPPSCCRGLRLGMMRPEGLRRQTWTQEAEKPATLPRWRHENAREPYQYRHGLPKEKSFTCKRSGAGYTTRRGNSTARRTATHVSSRRLNSPRPASYALGSLLPFGSTRLPPLPEPQGCAVFRGGGGSALARVGWRMPRSFTRMNNSAVSTCGSSFGRLLSSG